MVICSLIRTFVNDYEKVERESFLKTTDYNYRYL